MTTEIPLPGLLWEETVAAGASWTHVLKRGTALRITTLADGANVPAIFYNSDCPVERYSMPDTLKAQHTGHLTRGFVLYSDMGRVLCSVPEDGCGWHDLIGGHNTAGIVRDRFGSQRYQEHHNNFYRNTRDNFLNELANWGLGLRDLGANVNFFSKVQVDPDGAMHFIPGNSKAGDFIEIRAEMNVLVVLDTGQHPLDPSTSYSPVPIHLMVRKSAPAAADDACRLACPENTRGFINTDRYFL
ncbi:MAG TPA: urea amidolyase associated protein UAAP1 [Bryobacteraceae bacterium]